MASLARTPHFSSRHNSIGNFLATEKCYNPACNEIREVNRKTHGKLAREVGTDYRSERGIGRAFAFELAAGGTNLILVARRRDRLTELADELRAKYKILVEVCVADLAQPTGPPKFSISRRERI